MFKTRIGVIAGCIGFCFIAVLARLWQLQISRYGKYAALASRDRSLERMIPALRGPILDRYGNELAKDRPSFDLSVRVDRLKLQSIKREEVKEVRVILEQALARKDPEITKIARARSDADFDQLSLRLQSEPLVRDLSNILQRDPAEIADAVLKAIDYVERPKPWAGSATPLRIAGDIDEKLWLSLRSIHEDQLRIPAQPFPGLVCTLSTRRTYPHGRTANFVLGAVGELGNEEEGALREGGVLIDNAVARQRYWQQQREVFDEASAARIESITGSDPRMLSTGEVYTMLSQIRPEQRPTLAGLGLSEPLRWLERPARMQLTEPELLWLGVGLPHSTMQHRLPNRIIGELGVERYRNDLLRGKSGMQLPDVLDEDAAETYHRNAHPKEGQAIALTISLAWQQAIETALREWTPAPHAAAGNEEPAPFVRRGAIVVLDVKTGEILAMCSAPDFDPNLFAPPRDGPQRQEQLRAILSDPAKPLLNRAISEQYPLGSVMKSLIAAVALEKGLVSTTETFECRGYIMEGGQKFRCDDSRAHGIVNIYKGLRCSCNVTFHQIGARIGVENLGPYAKLILGTRTGIDLPGEVSGIYPDREWRNRAYRDTASRVWTLGSDYQLAIGQGQMTCTVLQSAVMMAAIGNGGYVVKPRIWLDGPQSAPKSLGISQQSLAIVRQGLDEVVNIGTPGERGTAYSPFHQHGPELAVRVAGKTSTAEHRKEARPHAWFAGYAPAENPQIAFAVFLEEAGHGGSEAAPLAYKFLRQIYGTKFAPVQNPGMPAPVAEVPGMNGQTGMSAPPTVINASVKTIRSVEEER